MNLRKYFQVLGITFAVLMIIAIVVWSIYLFTNPHWSGDEGLTQEEIATVKPAEGKVNVLVLGVDKEGLRTDTIMVVSYDVDNKTVKALSIPRDTRMYIGSRYQKINAASAIVNSSGKQRGPQGTVEAVKRLTNIPINYYICFTFDSLAECMDAVGPVEFEIPDLNDDGVGMVYDDPVQDLHINLKPGLQELDGEQIVHLLRYRQGNKINGVRRTYPDGDMGRIKVQQDFVKELVDQKLNIGLVKDIPDIFKAVSKDLKTNLTIENVMSYCQGLDEIESEDIEIYSLPGDFGDESYDAAYWICDLDETRELIEDEFGYDASKITIDKEYVPDSYTDNEDIDSYSDNEDIDSY